MSVCTAGDCTADCKDTSSCSARCAGGGCNFKCGADGSTDEAECHFHCEGGDCPIVCQGNVNCDADCAKGGCTFECLGTSNCVFACGSDKPCTYKCETTEGCEHP
jgi:hypothetical protein